MKRRIAVMLLALALAGSCLAAGSETALFADVLRSVDYGNEVTYVIGHKSPDADTIGSAIAYTWLLQQLGINAKPAAAGQVNRETQYALDFFGMEQPEILTDAAGKQFILVDHSEYSQALDGMEESRVVGIVDHHGIGDVRNTERIAVISLPTGAAASIVYRLYDGMKAAKTSFDGMTVSEIFHSDYKEYTAGEVTFGIGSVYTETEESLAEVTEMIEAEFPAIYASDGQDMLFCLISTDETTWMIWYGKGAEQAVLGSFPEYDGSGRMIFVPKASRKEDIVPPLTTTLENGTEADR